MRDWKRGDVVTDQFGEIRVMAVADKYAMLRRKGRYPFVLPLSELDAKELIYGGAS